MFKMMIRSIAVVALLALVSPVAVLAVDSGATTQELAPQAVVASAPVSAANSGDTVEAPSLMDMLLGFFHSVVGVGAPLPGSGNSGQSPEPQGRGPLIDPMGNQAN